MNPLVAIEATRAGACYGLTAEEVVAPCRGKSRDEARAITAWVLRQSRGFSYPELGRYLNRDYTSMMSAIKRVDREIRERPDSIFAMNAITCLARATARSAAE